MRPVWLTLSMLLVFLLAASATSPGAAAQHGPSFDCASPRAQDQPVARVICGTPDIAAIELSYVQAHFALRHHLGPGPLQRQAVERARLFPLELAQQCSLPENRGLPDKLIPTYRDCVRAGLMGERAETLARLPRQAVEEALRSPREAIELQGRLRDRGLLPQQGALDGLYGPQTRSAITTLQRQAGLPQTGFLDEATAAALGLAAQRAQSPSQPSAVSPGCVVNGQPVDIQQLAQHCRQLAGRATVACEPSQRSCPAIAAETVRLCLEGPESATASGFVLPRTGGAPPFCAGYLR